MHKYKCTYVKFYVKMPEYKKQLRTFGEMQVVRSIN